MLLIPSRAIIIAEMKQLTAASEKPPHLIKLRGKENGPWDYTLMDEDKTSRIGGLHNKKNPYKQIEQNRHDFAEWLTQNSKSIFGSSWTKRETLKKLCGWLVISPGFNGDISEINLPWNDIKDQHHWFQIVSKNTLAWQFHCTTINNHKLSNNEMHILVDQLGAVRVTNMGEVLPNTSPGDTSEFDPPTIFSRLAHAPKIIGRAKEMESLYQWLKEPGTSIISVEGMGGVVKTTLLKHLCSSPEIAGWQVKYISCKEKDLSIESFLMGVAVEIQDLRKAYLVGSHRSIAKDMDNSESRKKQIELIDRLDTALDYLESQKTILIFDDFQRVSQNRDLDILFLHAPARSQGLKCVICSRDHADILDHPDLSFNIRRKLVISGFNEDEVKSFINSHEGIQADQRLVGLIYNKTKGNPYLISLLMPHILQKGWDDLISSLSLYKKDFSNWFGSLLETLTPEALALARKLSLIQNEIPPELIRFLCHDNEKAFHLTNELLDNYILQYSDLDDTYRMHDYLREYLDHHTKDPHTRHNTLMTTGEYYLHKFQLKKINYEKINLFLFAIHYYDLAGDLSHVFESSPDDIFETLYNRGETNKASIIAHLVIKFARQKKDTLRIAKWLIKLARIEFDQGHTEKASSLIMEAETAISAKSNQKRANSPELSAEINAQISIAKARIAYHQADFDLARSHLEGALDIATSYKLSPLRADIHLRLARLEWQKGNISQARRYFQEAKKISNELKDAQIYIESISHLGLIARSEGDNASAYKHFTQASHFAKKIQDWRGYEINRSLIADLSRRNGDYDEAAKIFKECLNISNQFGNGIAIRVNMGQLAECLIQTGKLKEALPYLDEVQERCERSNDGIGLAWNYRRRGLYMKRAGNISEGDELIKAGISKLTEIGSTIYINDFIKDLGPEQAKLPGFKE